MAGLAQAFAKLMKSKEFRNHKNGSLSLGLALAEERGLAKEF
jgi:hypothetical protein